MIQSDEPLTQNLLDGIKGGEDVGLAMMNGDGVLKVSAGLAVACACSPTVAFGDDILAAQINHGLDGNCHAIAQQRAGATTTEVGHLGVLVELATHAVSAHLTHDTVVASLAILLDGVGDIANAVAGHCVLDADIERLLGRAQQLEGLLGDIADTESVGAVAVEPLGGDGTAVTGHDVAILENIVRRDAMHHHLVDRGAERGGEAVQPFEAGRAALRTDILFSDLVETACSHTGSDNLGHLGQGARHDQISPSQHLDLLVCLEIYHSD